VSATTIKCQQAFRGGCDQKLWFRRGRENADGEADSFWLFLTAEIMVEFVFVGFVKSWFV